MAWLGKRDVASETAESEPAAPEIAASAPVASEPAASEPAASEIAASAAVASPSVVFQPGPPIDDWDAADDARAGASAEPAASGAPALEWAIKARPATRKDVPRTPLQEAMAEIAEKHKDGPIEDMAGPIREALVAHGREVPDDWILAIAEGLRQHGPISLNLGGPGPEAS